MGGYCRRRAGHWSFVVSAALGVALACGEAGAEPELSHAERVQRARALYKVGQSHALEMHDYRGAIDYFEQSYRLVQRPLLLFDIATVAREANMPEKALDYYERYLASADPGDSGRAEAARYVVELRKKVQAQPQPPAAPAGEGGTSATTSTPTNANTNTNTNANANTNTPALIPTTTTTIATTDETAGRRRRWMIAGVSLFAVGVGIAGAGVGLAVASKQAGDDITRNAAAGSFDPNAYARGQNEQIAGDVLISIGAAAAVTGGILALVTRGTATKHASVQPWVAGRSVGLGLVLR
jgi:hypothetical protein